MKDSLIFKRFKEFGLSSYEAKCYLSLLEKHTMTVSEVFKLAGIPRANAYEAMEKLLAKGLCISKPGTTKKYSAVDPELLREKFSIKIDMTFNSELKKLDRKKDEVLDQQHQTMSKLSDLVNELLPLYQNSRSNEGPIDYVEILKDPYQTHKKLVYLCQKTEKEIIGLAKPPYISNPEQIQEQFDSQTEQMKKGIAERVIYEIPDDEEEKLKWLEIMELPNATDGDIRVMKNLPVKMIIWDEKIVMFSLEDSFRRLSSVTSVVIEHRALAKGLKMLFESLWIQAENFQSWKAEEIISIRGTHQ
jgi:sugar-specific transcriptional regulator TrmB